MAARKTNRKKKKPQKRTQKKVIALTATADIPTAPVIESHSFKSSMTFDGKTLTTKTQKDNEPVVEHRFTRNDLAREIPIGKEMVDEYLDGKMPKELQYHNKNKPKMFTNVLISPGDLGLLPPRMNKTKRRRDHAHDHAHDHGELQLLVDDNDPDADNVYNRNISRRRRRFQPPRNLFELP
jgi:hypothetical protein